MCLFVHRIHSLLQVKLNFIELIKQQDRNDDESVSVHGMVWILFKFDHKIMLELPLHAPSSSDVPVLLQNEHINWSDIKLEVDNNTQMKRLSKS